MDPLALAVSLTAAVCGALLGTVTGLVPGLHVNTLALLVLTGAGGLAAGGLPLPALALALVAASAAHGVAASVPGTFLGAPDPESVAHALPAHRLLHEGRGFEAADLHATGVVAGTAVALLLAVPLAAILLPLAPHIARATPVLLLLVCLALLLTERCAVPYRRALLADEHGVAPAAEGARGGWRAGGTFTGTVEAVEGNTVVLRAGPRRVTVHEALVWHPEAALGERLTARGLPVRLPGRWSRALGPLLATAVFLLAGAVGILSLRLPLETALPLPPQPLFALFTGLFAFPGLFLSLAPASAPRRQVAAPATEGLREVAGAAAAGGFLGSLVGLLPALSPSHAGVVALGVTRDRRPERALLVSGAVAGAATAFAVVLFFTWDRTRNGALVVARALAPSPAWTGLLPPPEFAVAAGAVALGAAVAYGAGRRVARALAERPAPTRALPVAVAAALAGLVLLTTGPWGLALSVTATAVGFVPVLHGLRRSHLMGVLLVPLLLSLWGIPI